MKKYKAISIHDLPHIKQTASLDQKRMEELTTLGKIYPFRTNEYVLDELINWDDFENDPIYRLNFPVKEMLTESDYDIILAAQKNLAPEELKKVIRELRLKLNPHPAGQLEMNIPYLNDLKLNGYQHKYQNTILFFPAQGQTCHAYCTFCFRWPQFVGDPDLKIATNEVDLLIKYLSQNPQITDILITGGDPMVMNSSNLKNYLQPLMTLPSVKNIRIGSKSLSFWPYKYLDGDESMKVLEIFSQIIQSGKHLSFMAHFNHPVELSTPAVKEAIKMIRGTGAEIRTQSPILKHINDDPRIWAELWEKQVQLGCVPYYMFLPRDTGAQHHFGIELSTALSIFREAIGSISGLCRTVRGPIMSTDNGKVEILDYNSTDNIYMLRFIQHRNPTMSYKCFYGRPNTSNPIWLSGLEPLHDSDAIFFR